MAILIGHASINENGNTSGGIAGDQTGKEVCTRAWYSKPWDFVLRCRDSAKAEKMAAACEAGCANALIGYDQKRRNTLYAEAKAVDFDLNRITSACECDCSSFMTVCALAAGIPVAYGANAPTTSTMQKVFYATGAFDVLTDAACLTSDACLKRGDILVKTGSHTVMALQDGCQAATVAPVSAYTHNAFVKEVQTAIGAKADGIAGSETLSKVITVSKVKNNRHAAVKPVQKYLNTLGYPCGTADGIAGDKFDRAVKAFQTANKLTADGIIGIRTWKKLLTSA